MANGININILINFAIYLKSSPFKIVQILGFKNIFIIYYWNKIYSN